MWSNESCCECFWPRCFLCSEGLWRETAAVPPALQTAEEFPPDVWSAVWCCSTTPPCGPAETHTHTRQQADGSRLFLRWQDLFTSFTMSLKQSTDKTAGLKPPGCFLWAHSLISGTRGRLRSVNHRGLRSIVPVCLCVVWADRWTARPAWSRGVSWACSERWWTGDHRRSAARLEKPEDTKIIHLLQVYFSLRVLF